MNQLNIENKWQKIWKKEKTFEPKIDKKKEKFFINVPYPYANSAMHIGHGRTFTMADIIARYNRLLGNNVLFPMAYHISGTPVLAVSDGIKRKDKKQIQQTKTAISDYIDSEKEKDEMIKNFEDPNQIANFFSSKIEETFDSVGLGIDYSRQFTTGHENYQRFVEWQFKKLNDAGILTQGKYPILYSPNDGNAVGEDDIKDGDTDKVSLSEMKYIKFKLEEENEFLVAATLRPDSIFGATNVYVKPDMDLVKLKLGKDIWIVSKASQVKIENQFDNVEFISDHKGKEFLEKKVIVPIIDKLVPILPMDYPDENHGTGIVYSSPADSPHDYIYLFELKFPGKSLKQFENDPLELTPITKTIGKKGNEIKYKSDIPAFDKLLKLQIYNVKGNEEKLEQAKEELYKEAHFGAVMINCGKYDNTPLKNNQGADKVTEELKETNMGGIFYETSRRAVTRANDPVIVANLEGQWFLNYSEQKTKDKALDLLENMKYLPHKLKDSQKGYLNWVQMRPCARKRGIGTKLPFDKDWVIESLSDSTIYTMLYIIYGILKREKINDKSLTSEFFDFIYLNKGNKKSVSKETNISEKILDELTESVKYWKGSDLRYTAPPHMSNHLSFLIYHYALIFPKENHPKSITVGGLMIADGHKISKSKGNGIPLIQVKEKFGCDLFRLYIGAAANYDIEMDFRQDEIIQLEKKFNRWKILVEKAIKEKKKDYNKYEDIDKWLISKFYSRTKEYFEHMKDLRIREAYVAILYEFLNDINYHERRTSEKQTIEVLNFIARDYILLMTPVTSHICEEFFEILKEKEKASLTKFDTDLDKFISKEIEEKENISEKLIASVYKKKDQNQIKEIKKVTIVQADDNKFKLFDELKTQLSKTKNIKDIFGTLNKNYPTENKFIKKFVPKTLGEGLSFYMNKKDELKYFEELKKFLEKEFKCEINFTTNEELENRVYAIPGEPGILID